MYPARLRTQAICITATGECKASDSILYGSPRKISTMTCNLPDRSPHLLAMAFNSSYSINSLKTIDACSTSRFVSAIQIPASANNTPGKQMLSDSLSVKEALMDGNAVVAVILHSNECNGEGVEREGGIIGSDLW